MPGGELDRPGRDLVISRHERDASRPPPDPDHDRGIVSGAGLVERAAVGAGGDGCDPGGF